MPVWVFLRVFGYASPGPVPVAGSYFGLGKLGSFHGPLSLQLPLLNGGHDVAVELGKITMRNSGGIGT